MTLGLVGVWGWRAAEVFFLKGEKGANSQYFGVCASDIHRMSAMWGGFRQVLWGERVAEMGRKAGFFEEIFDRGVEQWYSNSNNRKP